MHQAIFVICTQDFTEVTCIIYATPVKGLHAAPLEELCVAPLGQLYTAPTAPLEELSAVPTDPITGTLCNPAASEQLQVTPASPLWYCMLPFELQPLQSLWEAVCNPFQPI